MSGALSIPRSFGPYAMAATLLALSQGLGQGFLSANLPQMAGELGVSTADASWLMVAYMAPRASLPLILSKARTQFGLVQFAKTGALLYALMSLAACFITDFHSAVVVQFLMGCAAAPMSTLAFLYLLETLPQQLKIVLGLPLALAILMSGANIARVLSPSLVGDGHFIQVHLLVFGMALIALALVRQLPLKEAPREKVLGVADFTTFGLIAISFGGFTCAFVMGPIYWWTAAPWVGWVMAGSILAITGAIAIELARKAPMIDFRWLASPAMIQMMGAMIVFRLLLSEQSAGVPRLLQVLGFGADHLVGLFAIISIVSLLVPLVYLAWYRPGREVYFHITALLCICLGAYLDASSTVLTVPLDFALSQVLISFAGMLFMPAAMIMGLMSALKRGPSYLLSFIIVFLASQSLGGVIGSGIFSTLVNNRQAVHFQHLSEQILTSSPQVQSQISIKLSQLLTQTSDMAAARVQASASLIEEATRQSWVMAYNDAYIAVALAAAVALALLLAKMILTPLYARLTQKGDDASTLSSAMQKS